MIKNDLEQKIFSLFKLRLVLQKGERFGSLSPFCVRPLMKAQAAPVVLVYGDLFRE